MHSFSNLVLENFVLADLQVCTAEQFESWPVAYGVRRASPNSRAPPRPRFAKRGTQIWANMPPRTFRADNFDVR